MQSFVPRDAFVLKIQSELCNPKYVRKVSELLRNGPLARTLGFVYPSHTSLFLLSLQKPLNCDRMLIWRFGCQYFFLPSSWCLYNSKLSDFIEFQSFVKEAFRVRREALRSSFTEVEGVSESMHMWATFTLYCAVQVLRLLYVSKRFCNLKSVIKKSGLRIKLWYFKNVGSSVGAVVRALAFHQCGPGSIPGSDVICGLSLLVLYSAPRGFSPGTPVFPSHQKPTFDLIWFVLIWFPVSPISRASVLG